MQGKETLVTVYDKASVTRRVAEIATEVEAWRQGEPLVAVCVLKGAFLFFADLVRRMGDPVSVEFLRASSYGGGTESSGQVTLSLELQTDLSDKRVLVVEDIVDTGLSMEVTLDYLRKMNPKALALCALISKTHRRKADIPVDFTGFELPKGFLVGYGLDYDERYRQLEDICELRFE